MSEPPRPLTEDEISITRSGLDAGDFGGASYSIECLLDEVRRARALLRRIEWGRHGGECPACGEMPEGAHTPDCDLAALIPKR